MLLKAEHLAKQYKKRLVVSDVSFQIAAGEIVGLLGPNGAGKTTCFYMVVGLIPCGAGHIALGETNITQLPMHLRARLGLGYLPQEASIFRKLTVEQNILAILETLNLSKKQQQEKCMNLLEEFHVQHLRDSLGLSLSGGERRRVEIARALATDPKFILLDEPFAGVDPLSVTDIQNIIKHLKQRGIGILITDHNVRETLGICERAYIINAGTVLASGAPAAILKNDQVRKVYLGEGFSM